MIDQCSGEGVDRDVGEVLWTRLSSFEEFFFVGVQRLGRITFISVSTRLMRKGKGFVGIATNSYVNTQRELSFC